MIFFNDYGMATKPLNLDPWLFRTLGCFILFACVTKSILDHHLHPCPSPNSLNRIPSDRRGSSPLLTAFQKGRGNRKGADTRNQGKALEIQPQVRTGPYGKQEANQNKGSVQFYWTIYSNMWIFYFLSCYGCLKWYSFQDSTDYKAFELCMIQGKEKKTKKTTT